MTETWSCAIAVMAKAPRLGQVKTRLIPPLNPESALAMSTGFLRDITENLRLAANDAPITPYVAFAPAGTEPLFDGILARGTSLILADGQGEFSDRVQGFGRVLLHATRTLFATGHQSVCLLNSDSPTLPTKLLVQAANELARPGDRMVLGPADDGGYYLIGIKAPHARLFEEIAWSTEMVAAQTRERARSLGLDIVELESWYDVDDVDGLRKLVADLAMPEQAHPFLAAYSAPATARCVDLLGLKDLENLAITA